MAQSAVFSNVTNLQNCSKQSKHSVRFGVGVSCWPLTFIIKHRQSGNSNHLIRCICNISPALFAMSSLLRQSLRLVRLPSNSIPNAPPLGHTPTRSRSFCHLTTNRYIRLDVEPNASASFHTSDTRPLFWERDRRGGYDTRLPELSRKQQILEGLRELKQEIVLWKEEVKEKLESDPVLVFRPGEYLIIYIKYLVKSIFMLLYINCMYFYR